MMRHSTAVRATTLAPILSLGLISLLAFGCGSGEPTARLARQPQGASRVVRVAPAVTASAGGVLVPATIEAAQISDVASRVAAIIEKVSVEEGDFVEQGRLLVRLDGRDLEAQISAAEAAAKASRAHLSRIQSLFGKDAATSQELEAAEQQEAAAAAGVRAARAQLDYIEIRAPFAGWVTGRAVDPGDLAAPGKSLVSLQSRGKLRAVATLAEDQVAVLTIGQPIDVVLQDGGVISSHVALLNPAGDPASRRFEVKVDLPEGTRARPGAFARLRLPAAGGRTRLLVPRAGVIERGGLTGIFVVEKGVARLRWISPGESGAEGVVVRAGVSEGELVVLDPAELADGTPVTVEGSGTVP